MNGRIPQSFIDELLDRTDIVEVIDRRVSLKKAGKNYKACCPFHNEKTPSFNVNPDKQFYHCFGCGAGGNVVSFVMDFDNVDFPQAIEILADNLGLEVPKEQLTPAAKQRQKQQQSIYDVMLFAQRFYQQALRKHPEKTQAVDYLKQRGLSGEVARDFGIGFAPPGWDNLLELARNDNNLKTQTELLETAGLLVKKDSGGYYDRFRHRVMFPIRDNRGRVIAFGGRVLGDETPKYLNSPETSVFHKQRELYGLYEARKQNNQLDTLVMVEGYMDVVSLFQFGINYAVATLGTASSSYHLEKIFRHTARLVVCFDGDAAGQQAAMRLLETALPAMQDGREIAFLFLPDGEDPDSFVRRIGKEAFEQALKEATPLEQILFDKHEKGVALDSDAAKVRFCRAVLGDIALLPTGLFKQSQIKRLARLTQTEPSQLEQQLAELQSRGDRHSAPEKTSVGQQRNQQSGQQPSQQPLTPSDTTVQTSGPNPNAAGFSVDANTLLAISTLLHYPSLAKEIEPPENAGDINESKHPLTTLRDIILQAEQETGSEVNIARLFGYLHHQTAMRELLRQSSGLPEPSDLAVARKQLMDAAQRINRTLAEPAETQKLQQITHKPPSQLSASEKEILKNLGRD